MPLREGEEGLSEVALGDAARDADAPEGAPDGPRPLLAAADLTGDGAVEIVHAAPGGRLRVLRRADDGALAEIARADLAPVALAKGDVDNDGRTDLVAATADGALRVLRNAETTSDGALRLEPDHIRHIQV